MAFDMTLLRISYRTNVLPEAALSLVSALAACAVSAPADELQLAVITAPSEVCFDAIDDDGDGINNDGCTGIEAPVQATFGPGQARMFLNVGRSVAVDGTGIVHQVWLDVTSVLDSSPAGVRGKVMYRSSSDNGRSWSPAVARTPEADYNGHPKIAAFGANLYIAYHARAVAGGPTQPYLLTSLDHGGSWLASQQVASTAGTGFPTVAAFADTVHVVWASGESGGVPEVFVRSSVDRGASWGPVRQVSGAAASGVPFATDGFSSWTPTATAWGPRVAVAWTDERHDLGDCRVTGGACREELYARISNDAGATWGAEQRLTQDPVGAPQSTWAPSLQAWQDQLHLAYFDRRDGARFQVFYRRSLDGGQTWQGDRLLTGDPAMVQHARPSVAVLGNEVQIALWGTRSDGKADVMFTRSGDGGAAFTDPVIVSRGTGAVEPHPSIALSPNGTSFMSWYDGPATATRMFTLRRCPTGAGC